MITAARFCVLGLLLLAGCETAKRVAVTSFRVVDAPARYMRERVDAVDQPRTTTTTSTTTVTNSPSDVSAPGHPIVAPTATSRPRATATPPRRTASPAPRTTPRPQASATPRKLTPTPTPRPAAATSSPTQFPVAKPVPGKPGYVFSLDPNGGMVDVTGYKSGDKARDPYTKQIFIVP